MLDRLLGRAELKEQVAALEDERERLRNQLEAETERRREAVRDRQAADERVNELEDKIAELEGRLERESSERAGPAYDRVTTVGHERAGELVRRLSSLRTDREGALSALVPDDTADPDGLVSFFDEEWELVTRAAPCLAFADDEGLLRVLLDPPLTPEPFTRWDDRFRIESDWFVPTGRFTLALIRSDLFAAGVYDGTERVEMEGFRSDVRSDHSKGGFSQGRFERRRQEQVDDHLSRCREALSSLEPDRLIVVGERTVLSTFRTDADATAAVDATGPPDEALADAFRSFWRTQVYVL